MLAQLYEITVYPNEENPSQHLKYKITKTENIIGKNKHKSDIPLIFSDISDVHAKLTILGPDDYIIKDLNSENGIYRYDSETQAKQRLVPGKEYDVFLDTPFYLSKYKCVISEINNSFERDKKANFQPTEQKTITNNKTLPAYGKKFKPKSVNNPENNENNEQNVAGNDDESIHMAKVQEENRKRLKELQGIQEENETKDESVNENNSEKMDNPLESKMKISKNKRKHPNNSFKSSQEELELQGKSKKTLMTSEILQETIENYKNPQKINSKKGILIKNSQEKEINQNLKVEKNEEIDSEKLKNPEENQEKQKEHEEKKGNIKEKQKILHIKKKVLHEEKKNEIEKNDKTKKNPKKEETESLEIIKGTSKIEKDNKENEEKKHNAKKKNENIKNTIKNNQIEESIQQNESNNLTEEQTLKKTKKKDDISSKNQNSTEKSSKKLKKTKRATSTVLLSEIKENEDDYADNKKKSQKRSVSNKSSRKPQFHIGISGFLLEPEEIFLLKRIGIKVIEDKNAMINFLILKTFKRTIRFLLAINRGCPILSKKWLDDCIAQEKIIDEESYIFSDKENEKKFGFKLQESLKSSRENKQGVFHGLSFWMPKNIQPSYEEMKLLIASGDGTILMKRPLAEEENSIILTRKEDIELNIKLKSQGFHLYTTEFVFLAVLRQKVDLEECLI